MTISPLTSPRSSKDNPVPKGGLLAKKEKDKYLKFLQEHPICKELKEESKASALASIMEVKTVASCHQLFKEGAKCKSVYWIYFGSIILSIKDAPNHGLIIATKKEGDTIGEMSVFSDEKRSATATTFNEKHDVVLFEIKKVDFEKYLKEQPEVFKGIIRKQFKTLKKSNASRPGLDRESSLSSLNSISSSLESFSLLEKTPDTRPQIDTIYTLALNRIEAKSEEKSFCLKQHFYLFFSKDSFNLNLLELVKLQFASLFLPAEDPYRTNLNKLYSLCKQQEPHGNHHPIVEKTKILEIIFNRDEKRGEILKMLWRKLQYIKGCSLFNHTSLEQKIKIAMIMEELAPLKEGQNLFEYDDIGDGMFIVVSGKIELYHQDRVFAYAKEGDCFGELALLKKEGRRSTSARPVRETILLKIPSQLLEITLGPEYPTLLIGIWNQINHHLRENNRLIASIGPPVNDQDLSESHSQSSVNSEAESSEKTEEAFPLPSLLEVVNDNYFTGKAKDEYQKIQSSLKKAWKDDKELSKLIPLLTKVYHIKLKWIADQAFIDNIDMSQVLRTTFCGAEGNSTGKSLFESIDINGAFFQSESTVASEFFFALFRAFYQAGLDPHRKDVEIKQEVERFIAICSLPKEKQAAFLKENPIPCIDLIRASSNSGWFGADDAMRSGFGKDFHFGYQQGIAVHFLIYGPSDVSVIQKKTIYPKTEGESKAAIIPVEGTIKLKDSQWEGTLVIPEIPGISAGENLEEYKKVLESIPKKR